MSEEPATNKVEALLLEAVEALRDLAGALIDNMPPQTQDDIASVQVRLLKAVRAYND